jgi:hypothetical protein
MRKWAGYEVLFASIFRFSLAIIDAISNLIWAIMKVERETINAACSLAPKRISPE